MFLFLLSCLKSSLALRPHHQTEFIQAEGDFKHVIFLKRQEPSTKLITTFGISEHEIQRCFILDILVVNFSYFPVGRELKRETWKYFKESDNVEGGEGRVCPFF